VLDAILYVTFCTKIFLYSKHELEFTYEIIFYLLKEQEQNPLEKLLVKHPQNIKVEAPEINVYMYVGDQQEEGDHKRVQIKVTIVLTSFYCDVISHTSWAFTLFNEKCVI